MATLDSAAADLLAVSPARSRTANRLAWFYLVLALPLVVLFATIMAPVQVADEFNHAMRADQISRGTLLERIGGVIDGGVAAFGHIFDGLYFHPENKVTVEMATRAGDIGFDLPDSEQNFQNTAQYGPLLYVPDAIGIAIGKAAGWKVAHTLLLARILNGVASALIAFAALLILRHGRALAFTTLLLPMSLSAFGSASQDAPVIALTILAAALVSRAVDERRLATTCEFALFLAIVVATTMARPSQFALLALLPAMGGWRQGSLQAKAILFGLALIAIAAWIVTLRLWLMPPTAPDWNVGDQFRLIVTQPLTLPLATIKTLARDWFDLWGSVIGRFGWYDAPMPRWVQPVGAAACLCALLAPGNRPPFFRPAFWALATFIAAILAIAAALYMSWTAVGKDTVDGFQGRYVLPILPLLGWLIPAYGPRLSRMLSPLWIAVFAFPVVLIPTAVWTLMDRYYGSWDNMQAALTALLLS